MKAVKVGNISTCIWTVSTAAFTVINGVWDFSGTTTQSMTSKTSATNGECESARWLATVPSTEAHDHVGAWCFGLGRSVIEGREILIGWHDSAIIDENSARGWNTSHSSSSAKWLLHSPAQY